MDEKVRENARYAIKSILESAGFSVNTLEDPFDLAEREDKYLMILCSDDEGEIEEFNTGTFRLIREGQEIEYRKLLFSLLPGISAQQCIIWGQDEFIRFSGEAALSRVLERPLPVSFSGDRTYMDLSRTSDPESSGQHGPAGEEPMGMVIAHLPVRIQKEAAEKIAKISGQANLKFMPYWRYSYQSSGEQSYKEHRVPFDAEGSGGINAINGLGMDANWDAVIEAQVPQNADIVEPRITRDEATEKIVTGIIESLTQKIRIRQVIGDAISYEERVMKPDRRNIACELQQVYVPVWQVRGKKIVEVNAHTGEVLAEPMDEGVEVF